MARSEGPSDRPPTWAEASATVIDVTSAMLLPDTRTARLSARRRLPPHPSHDRSRTNRRYCSRIASDAVSRKRRSSVGITPAYFMAHVPWFSLPCLPHLTPLRAPLAPYSTRLRLDSDSLLQGVSRSILKARAIPSTMRAVHPSPRSIAPAQWAMAPCRIDFLRSGTSSCGSISSRLPSPLHDGHIPSGELNEKLCGDSSGGATPQHARAALYRRSLPPWTFTRSSPRPSRSPASTAPAPRG